MIRANMEVLIFTLECIGWIQALFLWILKISEFRNSTTPSDSPSKISQEYFSISDLFSTKNLMVKTKFKNSNF